MIRGCTVIGDLMRPEGSGRPGGADRPTLWLWNAVRRSIALAAGLETEVLTVAGSPPLLAWLESERTAAEADIHWAANHKQLPRSSCLEDCVVERLRGRFVVGYEMPPWLVILLNAQRVPFIDIRLHPVRFMDDLMFASRSSLTETQAEILAMAVKESEVIVTAGLRQAMCCFISEARLPENTLLVAGQRRYDSTQIIDGRFWDALPFVSDINAVCARYSAVVLKPHPLDRHHSLLTVTASASAPVLGVIDDNIYRLMALPQIAGVLTVNSGVAHEAPYFGKKIHHLAPLTVHTAWGGDAVNETSHAALDDVVLTPDFWRLVLAPHTSVSPPDGMRLHPKPNRLRIALDSFWNYQQIDTDRIPPPALSP